MRLYVDDKLLIDGWGKDKSADQALDFHFEAGRTYKIRIEFVNDRRGARVIFGYSAGREKFPRSSGSRTQSGCRHPLHGRQRGDQRREL